MNYIEVTLRPDPMSEDVCDVLAAVLAPLGYDSFSTEDTCLKAYVTQNLWDAQALEELLSTLPLDGVSVAWTQAVIEMEDWNQAWEQSQQFEPITVGEVDAEGRVMCCVHSPAAPQDSLPKCRYEVIIDPKMSFGSGTHETTSQLLEEILLLTPLQPETPETPLNPETPAHPLSLDMGTGTGVLAILCGQLGYQVRAIEIDDWVASNAVDNVLYNGLAGTVKVECGDASLLTEGPTYQLVLANINRNVLLADMASYERVMLPGATLLMSGFYEEDVPAIRQCAEQLGLVYQSHRSRNNWVVIRFLKPIF